MEFILNIIKILFNYLEVKLENTKYNQKDIEVLNEKKKEIFTPYNHAFVKHFMIFFPFEIIKLEETNVSTI